MKSGRGYTVLFCAVVMVLMWGSLTPALAQPGTASEYQVKAAFLYNFAKFIDWPPGRNGQDSSVFIVGVYGETPFSTELTGVLRGKMVGNRRIIVRRVSSPEEARACHILFLPSSAADDLSRILSTLNGRNVLTVGDEEDFAIRGAVISFMLSEGKIRFVVNMTAASQAKLRISSKLLNLAQIISDDTADE